MSTRQRRSNRAGRPAIRSPGRPTAGRRDHRQRFWAAIARGRSSEDAAAEAGVSAAVGVRWFREGGGMPSVTRTPLSGRYLSFGEREEIMILRTRGCGVREIARRLGRSSSTISRELRRNAATRGGGLEYRASTAQWHADRRGRRPKPAKLATNSALRRYVQDRLAGAVERPGGIVVDGPVLRGSVGVTAVARTGDGQSRGARSRSRAGCALTSPMMSRCASRTKRSTSRCMCRAGVRCGAS
jgi:transposase